MATVSPTWQAKLSPPSTRQARGMFRPGFLSAVLPKSHLKASKGPFVGGEGGGIKDAL